MWTKAQHRKFKQTMAARKNHRKMDRIVKETEDGKQFLNQAAVQAIELENIRKFPAPNPARALHETLDAYFGHLGLELKMDAIRYLVVQGKER